MIGVKTAPGIHGESSGNTVPTVNGIHMDQRHTQGSH